MWSHDKKTQEAKYRPIYSPRTAYLQIRESDEDLLADLTLNFDKFTINLLKKQFEVRDGEITLVQFISIVDRHLKSWQSALSNRQVRLVRCLTNLFNEIDINGNGLMDWQEFTNYIIQKATVLKNLKTKSSQVKSYTRANLNLKEKVESCISKCIYVEYLDRIALLEQGSHTITFMNHQTGQFNPKPLTINMKQLVVNISSVKKEKDGRLRIKKKDLVLTTNTRILDMICIPDERYKMLITSSSDGVVRGWRCHNGVWALAPQPDNEQESVQHHFSQEVYCLSWDSINEVLYCGLNNGGVVMWNFKTDTQKMFETSGDDLHTLIITEIIPMPKLQFVATASMDSKIILWNTINYRVKSIYKQHTRGILTMAFNQPLILLFSAGFDHNICIWNPYISALIHKIQSHSFPIVSLRITQNSTQLLSVDSEGNVKISDTRRFNNVSGFSVVSQGDMQKFIPSSMCVVNNPLKVAIMGNSINIFQYDKLYNPNSVDDFPAICCKFIEENLSFLTPVGNRVKVWNALNGDVDKIFSDITTSEISSFCLDGLKKRMVIGTVKGDCGIYNCLNGAKLKQLPKHSSEITHILSHRFEEMEVFFIASLDGQVLIYKEMEELHEAPRTINITKDRTITKMTYCEKFNLLILGTSNGWVGLYDRETVKLVGSWAGEEEIVGLHLADQAVIVAGGRGSVTFVGMGIGFEEGFSFHHRTQGKLEQMMMSDYNQKHSIFYAADSRSSITAYKLTIEETLLKTNTKLKPIGLDRMEEAVATLWVIKTHSEMLKSVSYIVTEDLLITTSYDKRVNIWSALDGKFIDSLQQNYFKRQPNPIAYQRVSNGQIFSASMEPLQKRRPSIRTSTRYKINLTQVDPFSQYQSIRGIIQNKRSNHGWKVFVSMQNHYSRQNQYFNGVVKKVRESNITWTRTLKDEKIGDSDLTISQKNSRPVNCQNENPQGNITTQTLLKSTQKLKALQPKLSIRLNREQKKIFGFFRRQSQPNHPIRQNQLKMTDRLSKSKKQFTMADNSTFRTAEEKEAVNKLMAALGSIDTSRSVVSQFYKSITPNSRKFPRIQ